MGLTIHLLGSPRVERDGVAPEPLRGHKAWGLLAFLVRSQVPPSRERVAGLLFPEADDPLGTLRWTLSVLRRHLGEQAELGGDPLELKLLPGTLVDVDVLEKGSWIEAVALPGLGHELLDGLTFRASPGFELWLENERRHVAGITSAVLHQAALALLARGEADAAARHASELVRLDPYDENAHVLLVRCLVASGDPAAASRHVETATELLRRELGIEPTPALRAAAVATEVPVAGRVSRSVDVRAQVEVGGAALAAGGVEAGVHQLRAAAAAARGLDDPALLSEVLVSLGGALGPFRSRHRRGGRRRAPPRDHHRGADGKPRRRRDGVAQISWVQFLRAHYERAEESLDRAADHAAGDERELAWVDLIRGACRHDVGDYPAAGKLLRSAV
ncbi:MAG TPA: BTAD domain-containing putative transcriptional regulator, partial [Actinomycetota bacterium]